MCSALSVNGQARTLPCRRETYAQPLGSSQVFVGVFYSAVHRLYQGVL